MSYGAAVGQVHWSCDENCKSQQHAIIERDYEMVPHIWQVVVGDGHSEVSELQTLLEAYFERVDDESTWFIQPVSFDLADVMKEAVEKEMEEIQRQEEDVKEISFGPVSNPDGTPTEFTKQMLEGTGRSLKPPFGPVTVITPEGIGQGMLHEDDHIEMITAEQGRLEGEYQAEDAHLEAAYEDRHIADDPSDDEAYFDNSDANWD